MTPIEWLLSSDTGVSSETILAVMTGSEKSGNFGPGIPHDPGDFGRCYRLLELFPEWKTRLSEVALKHPKWKPLVEIWGELTALYEEELLRDDGRMPKLYARMKSVYDDCMLADGWIKESNSSWRKEHRA